MKEVVRYVVAKTDAGWDLQARTGVRREDFGEEWVGMGTTGGKYREPQLWDKVCHVSQGRAQMCCSRVS